MSTGGRIKKHLADSLTAFEVVLSPSEAEDEDGDVMDLTVTARWAAEAAAAACGDNDDGWKALCLSLHPTLKTLSICPWGPTDIDHSKGLCTKQCTHQIQLTVPPSSDCPPLACMATACCLGNIATLYFAVPRDAVTAPHALALAPGKSICYQGVAAACAEAGSEHAVALGVRENGFHLLPHTAAEKVIQRRRA
jgi:hypothetical protein